MGDKHIGERVRMPLIDDAYVPRASFKCLFCPAQLNTVDDIRVHKCGGKQKIIVDKQGKLDEVDGSEERK